MAIFRIFKMAAAAILDFENFKFLTVGTVNKVKLHQCAKFHRNRSNCGRDMLHIALLLLLLLFVCRSVSSKVQLDVSYLSYGWRHLVNAYDVKAGSVYLSRQLQ